MESSNTYKWCAVPECTCTSIKTPTKLFIHVPVAQKMRNKWLQLARRDPKEISMKTKLFFCEDHFDLQKDMANFMQYTMGFSKKIQMTEGCVPSKFECQADRRKRTCVQSTSRAVIRKRQKLNLIEECEQTLEKNEPTETTTTPEGEMSIKPIPADSIGTANKCIQVSIKPFVRSKMTQTNIPQKDISVSPWKTTTKSCSTSPFKFEFYQGKPSTSGIISITKKLKFSKKEKSDSEISSICSSAQGSEISISSSEVEKGSSGSSEIEESLMLEKIRQNTLWIISHKPKFYIGIPKECYFLIDILHKHSKISQENILLCLKKIRLDTTFSELGDNFGISLSYASKIFLKSIPKIAKYLNPFIVNLNTIEIKKNLPIAFRYKFHNVHCIIDCLEIEIQKPSNAVHQALTWSEYKKANTIKYLISCTPDGLINYISPGYGGRISDSLLVETCDFLNNLTHGMSILADRGFKHLEQVLKQQGINLIRPPSVAQDSKLSKKEARLTKKIASLRIHVERVIRRVREFSMLKPHAVVNTNLIHILDEIIVIACALINLQASLIK